MENEDKTIDHLEEVKEEEPTLSEELEITIKEPKSTPKKKKAKTKVKSVATPAEPKAVNYRLTFLESQYFQGKYYKKGFQMQVPESIAKAYSKRTKLRFESL